MEKLAGLGLVQVQPTGPKMFAALPSEVVVARIIEIARERSERFAAQASELQATFAGLQSRVRGRHPFVDLALGVEGHNRRHLVPLAARKRILSYMEAGDLMAIDTAVKGGFPILRRIAKNAAEHGVEHRVVFGFSSHETSSTTARTGVRPHGRRQSLRNGCERPPAFAGDRKSVLAKGAVLDRRAMFRHMQEPVAVTIIPAPASPPSRAIHSPRRALVKRI